MVIGLRISFRSKLSAVNSMHTVQKGEQSVMDQYCVCPACNKYVLTERLPATAGSYSGKRPSDFECPDCGGKLSDKGVYFARAK